MKLKKSTNNIIHGLDKEGYYLCIRAVGKHVGVKAPLYFITCKNCLKKLKDSNYIKR